MKLYGCGCSGFSYTKKYKMAIITIYEWINEQCSDISYDYSEFQNKISNLGVSDNSEVRMIIPFLLKAGVINSNNCIKGGTRIKRIIINNNFFTLSGECFIRFLKIELLKDSLNTEEKNIVNRIYKHFGKIQFNYLLISDDYIYMQLYNFLRKYKYICKDEFFILTTCKELNRLEELDDLIISYRNNEIGVLEIMNNVNCYNYITKLLLQLGVLESSSGGYMRLSTYYLKDVKEDLL